MKSLKISLVAVMAGALALVLILGASMGTAALPDPNLSDDIVAMGNAGASNIKIIDVNGQAVVNTLSNTDGAGGGQINNNHGTLFDGRYIYTGNASMSGYNLVYAKYDLGRGEPSTNSPIYTPGTAGGAFCGVEFTQNNSASRVVWGERMDNVTGGAYGVNVDTYVTQGYVNTNPTANNNTCGIGWDTAGTTAYASLMGAMRTNVGTWGGAFATNGGALHTQSVHILDVAKSKGLIFTSHGASSGVGGGIYITDAATMTQVGNISTDSATVDGYSETHSAQVAHGETYLYAHSRQGQANQQGIAARKGVLFVYDISATTVANPVATLVGVIPDQGQGGSCGVDVGSKGSYCAQPALSLSKTATYWASGADYTNGVLSVDYSIANNSATAGANDVTIVGTADTNGVTLNSAPAALGIAAGEARGVTVKYNVPSGVGSFMSTVYATANDLCNNSYAYPGPMP